MEIIIIMDFRKKVLIVHLIFMANNNKIITQIIMKLVFPQEIVVFTKIIILILTLLQIIKMNPNLEIKFIVNNSLHKIINNIHQMSRIIIINKINISNKQIIIIIIFIHNKIIQITIINRDKILKMLIISK